MHPADATEDDAVARLRRQFEEDELPRHHFRSASIPDYPIFNVDRLPEELQQKLERRRARGYTNPRAMTEEEISDWNWTESMSAQDRIHRFKTGIKSEPGEDAKERRRRAQAEIHRYGGPLTLPSRAKNDFGCALALIAGLVFIASGIWLIVELVHVFANGEWSRAVITPGLIALVSIMVGGNVPDDTSGDLTDEDLPHIDRAIEHITLPYNSQEYRLAEYAADLTQRIADSPAWASNFLTEHRIELDYTQELREIVTHAHTLRSIRTELGKPPTGNSHDAIRARDHFEKISAPLDVVWLPLVERVAALESFTLHLTTLDTQLANMKAVGRATMLEDKIGGLLANAVSDEFAAEHTRSLTERSQYVSLSIEATLDALRGDIAGLTALSQSLPATYEAN